MRIQIRARRYAAAGVVAVLLSATCGVGSIDERRTPRSAITSPVPTAAGSPGPKEGVRVAAALSPRTAGEPGDPRFEDVTRAALGDRPATTSWGSVFTDHDRNSLPDLLVNRHKRQAWFFEGRSGGFRRAHRGVFQPYKERNYYDRHACSWGEANGDGKPDLLCVAGAEGGVGTGANQLLVQDGSRFRIRSKRYHLSMERSRGRSANWLDLDRDGDLDLFFGNEIRAGYPNRFKINRRVSFRRASIGAAQELATVTSTWSDWDGDRDPDLLVLAHGERGAQAFENRRGRFVRVTLNGVSGFRWQAAAWGDYDGDGRVDLHVISPDAAVVLRNVGGRFRTVHRMSLASGRMSVWLDVENDGDLDLYVVQGSREGENRRDFVLLRHKGRFEPRYGRSYRGRTRGNGEAVSAADFDRDGRTDLFVTNGYLEREGWVSLLRNRTKAPGNWIGLELHGGRWNPLGYGARVRVRTHKRVYWRYVNDSFNYVAQSEVGYLHFGIDGAPRARVRVRWAQGGCDRIEVSAGSIAKLSRGSRPCS